MLDVMHVQLHTVRMVNNLGASCVLPNELKQRRCISPSLPAQVHVVQVDSIS